jgi:hypothetical protein
MPRPKCPYCGLRFTPVSRGGSKQRFCKEAHRKLYHRYGAFPFDKLMDRIRKELTEMVRLEVHLVRSELDQLLRDQIRQALAHNVRMVPEYWSSVPKVK